MNNDLISRNDLEKFKILPFDKASCDDTEINAAYQNGWNDAIDRIIDNAPTVEPEKALIANVHFDENKLKEMVQTEVIDKIISGELVFKEEWTPVSERLPEYSGLYLISVDDLVTVANFTGAYFMNRVAGKVEVNAWQPLPEPYKEGGAE